MSGRAEFAGTQRFRLVSRLGEGGMGVVYEAHDQELDARVALKTLRTLTADAILRFKKEFRALQDLEHPNLVSFGELVEQDGDWFFTMELIEGVDFLSYVRGVHVPSSDSQTLSIEADSSVGGVTLPPWKAPSDVTGAFDAKRLRAGLGQLALGLYALHGAGKVHRDIKPSNVRVTSEGRVVLLDFGLVTEAIRDPSHTDAHLVGTPDYMAPEQAASKPVGPEADWYSVGVVLYQALAGRVPYLGPALEVLMNKQRFEPPPPAEIASGVPDDLNLLCGELLRFDPALRPSGRAVLRRLGIDPSAIERSATTVSSFSQAPPFVGRASELATLRLAYAQVEGGQPTSVVVIGESGFGKSTLVRQFTEELATSARPAVVLQGRCHERESVPYKAIDGVIDAISRYMGYLSETDAAQLVPRNAALLTQVFPVLRRVRALQQAPRPVRSVLDPEELRMRVFAAIRDLLTRLAERRSLVIVIDDFQWADADSLALLSDVMRPPDAPAFLLLATARPGADALIAQVPGEVRRLALGALALSEARELVALLAGRSGEDRAERIAGEAGGHPLFIQELVRSVLTAGDDAGGSLQLAEVLWSRIAKLDEPARKVLVLLAVAGTPLSHQTVCHAAETTLEKLTRQIAQLRVAHLVRATPTGAGPDAVECYHDRVRESAVAHLDAAGLAGCHRALALALEASPQADPEALALHWGAAGDAGKAAHYAVVAAGRAAEALAFNRAAQLLETALAMRTYPPDEARRLQRALADALASAGRGFDAAKMYLAAATGASSADELELTRLSAAQFLRSGHILDGLETLGKVMTHLGMSVPATGRRALGSLVLQRARIALRGLKWKPRDASTIAPTELGRLDILYTSSTCLGMIDHVRGADFQSRYLLAALAMGEERRVCRALAIEVVYRASEGRAEHPRVDALSREVDEHAERIGDPYLRAASHLARGARALFRFRYRTGAEAFAQAESIFSNECVGAQWERVTTRFLRLQGDIYSGRLGEAARRTAEFIQEAESQNDLYSRCMFRCDPLTWSFLREDQPELAAEELKSALDGWPRDCFYMAHLQEMFARSYVSMYAGRSAEALHELKTRLPEARRSMLMRVPLLGRSYDLWLAFAALAQRDHTTARACARRIGRLKIPSMLGFRDLILAAIAHHQGDSGTCLRLLTSAADKLGQGELDLFTQAVRHRLGAKLAGDEGATIRLTAEQAFHAQGVRNVPRMIAMLAPSFD